MELSEKYLPLDKGLDNRSLAADEDDVDKDNFFPVVKEVVDVSVVLLFAFNETRKADKDSAITLYITLTR